MNKLLISEVGSDQEEHSNLEKLVDFVNIDDVDGMIQRIDYWLNHTQEFNQRIAEIKQARNQPNQFQFFFYRFLLSQDLLEFDRFYELCGNYIQPKGDFWCLSLAESVERRNDFKKDNHYDIEIIEGLRHHIGWVGCGLSYKFMLKRAEDLNLPQVTICEDDVLFYNDFMKRYDEIYWALLSADKKWDIFSGLAADLHPDITIDRSNILTKNERIFTINRLVSTVFNIYNKSAYYKIYQWDYHKRTTDNTIDRYIESYGDIKGLIVSPFLVGHKEDLHSTLWGQQNNVYLQMIDKSQKLLIQKIRALEDNNDEKH